MEQLKKFQYTFVLFIISAAIFAIGVVPSGGKLMDLYVVSPDDYENVTGEVLAVEPISTGVERISYHVLVGFFYEEPDTGALVYCESVLESPVTGREVGNEIVVTVSKENPQYILQVWYEWKQFYIFLGFSMMGMFTGVMMMNPVTVESRARKPRTLRQRLEGKR